jgi:hypothetical protein
MMGISPSSSSHRREYQYGNSIDAEDFAPKYNVLAAIARGEGSGFFSRGVTGMGDASTGRWGTFLSGVFIGEITGYYDAKLRYFLPFKTLGGMEFGFRRVPGFSHVVS